MKNKIRVGPRLRRNNVTAINCLGDLLCDIAIKIIKTVSINYIKDTCSEEMEKLKTKKGGG